METGREETVFYTLSRLLSIQERTQGGGVSHYDVGDRRIHIIVHDRQSVPA